MLSMKIMRATEEAAYSLFCEEEAAHHYGYNLSTRDRVAVWSRGLVSGWLGDSACISIRTRLSAIVRKALRRAA
jgi:hypothetical protein